MSIRVMSQVWDESRQTGGTLLVLLAMADYSNDKGICWPSVEVLARKARLSERQTQRVLRRLEEVGEVRVVRRGGPTSEGNRATVYQVIPGQGCQIDVTSPMSPPDDADVTTVVTRVSPYPSVEPSVEPSVHKPRPRADLVLVDGGAVERPFATSVDRKAVTMDEHRFAVSVLDEFNAQAATKFGSKGYLAKIVLRRREHPDVDFEQHREIIRRNLAAPWWRGTLSPSVIYGNDTVFEQAMACDGVAQPRPGSRRDAERASQASTFDAFDRMERGDFPA